MNDDDRKFLEETELYMRSQPPIERLCRIIRELQAEIENAPVVYGTGSDHGLKWREGHWVNLHRKGGGDAPRCDTHRARLVRIEKLEGK